MMQPPRSAELSAVDRGIARFMISHEYERLRLYRLHLQATITRVSPLAIDLAAHGGFALDQVARRLPLPRGWPWPATFDPVPGIPGATWMHLGRRRPRRGFLPLPVDRLVSGRLARRGVVMRDADDECGELAYMTSGDELEVVARLGPCVLHAGGGRGRLLLPDQMPETLIVGLRGRFVDEVVDHPVLNGRGYRIRAVRSSAGNRPTIEFGIGTVPLELPWGAELQAQMEVEA